MAEQCDQRQRRQPLGGGARRESREPSRLGGGEGSAGGIVDRDVPASELARDPPRQRPVGCDKRGGLAALLQSLAQDEGDAERLLARIARLDQCHVSKRRPNVFGGNPSGTIVPSIGGGGGAKCFR